MNNLEKDNNASEEKEETKEPQENPRSKQPVRGPALRTFRKPIPRPVPA
jgi:hypothetical protein